MPTIAETDWLHLLRAWMHDPVDKALSIRDHESRARRYLSVALSGDAIAAGRDENIKSADITASIADRLPMPVPGRNYERAVGPEDGPILVYHPVSAQKQKLKEYELDEAAVSEGIASIVDALPLNPKIRFLALWRMLPGVLSERFGFDFTRLPADTRVPDHSLIQHADISSGIAAARQGRHGYAILSVTLGPVQTFIQSARSVRDLWSGSALLSWLIFQGMRPILENLGPTVFVFPALRGHPLMDMWLKSVSDLADLIPMPSKYARRAPSFPNRFVALVPYGSKGHTASAFAKECETSIRAGWKQVSNRIRSQLDDQFNSLCFEWDQHWDAQIESFFDISTSICSAHELSDTKMASLIGGTQEFSQVWKDAHRIREIIKSIPDSDLPRYRQDGAGEWQAQLEVSARIAEAQRTIRHVPKVPVTKPAGPKCSLLGSYEQVGPTILQDSANFWATVWERNSRLRKPDRFCAISLCKRFAAENVLAHELALDASDLRFPDTATIAARDWLSDAKITPENYGNWNGRWIHQQRPDEDGERIPPSLWSRIKNSGSPPSYYAIIVMDADDMGLWLRGKKAPLVREVIHEKVLNYFEAMEIDGLNIKRPVGPALHASISEALNHFASIIVPGIVNRFNGTLIYSGGDDVLALLPTSRAAECANELRKAFIGENNRMPGWNEIDGQHYLAMGQKATLSSGIAFVHYKEDLRLALSSARKAEKQSKDAPNKNCLTLHFMRRSGDHSTCVIPWSLVPWFQEAIHMFSGGVSDRWIYHLRREEPVLSDPELPHEAIKSEINRLIARSELDDATKQKVRGWWSQFCDEDTIDMDRLNRFTKLCLGASFVARGNDG